MNINKKGLDCAVEEKIISAEQADALFHFLQHHPSSGPSFNFTHVLYYLGGMIAIGAMSLFMTLGWEFFGGWGIFFISVTYALVGLKISSVFQSKGHAIPAGILATFVVAITPLAIYGLQQGLGIWPDESTYREYHKYIKWHWIFMELGTLAVGVVMARRYRYPFMIMPIAVTLWYMSMDVVVMLVGERPDYQLRTMFSMYFGLLMMLVAFWVDVRARKTLDYAFWLYIFGVMTFWIGMSAQHSDSELSKFVYFCINILMIGVGVLLVRRVFVVFGAIGFSVYLSHLASSVFKDSWLFPMALTAIGLLIIYLGVLWQKNEAAISQRARGVLPAAIRELLEARSS